MRFLSVLSLSAVLCLSCLVSAEARPVAVTLYPGGALITEEAELVLEEGTLRLDLPAGADENSLDISLSSGRVSGRRSALLPGVAAPAVNGILEELNTVLGDMDKKQAQLTALADRRLFWAQPPYSLNAPDEKALGRLMEEQAETVNARLNSLSGEEAALRGELRELERRVSALKSRLDELGQQNGSIRRCNLSVTGTAHGPVKARWSYYLNDAGWEPRYLVQADQKNGRVTIRMEASIRQVSGSDWDGVELELSSAENFRNVTPPDLPDWIIGGERIHYASPRAMNLMAAKSSTAEADAATAGIPYAAGMIWKVGRTDIPAGTRVIMPVSSHELAAEFIRLAIPSISGNTWFQAVLGKASPLFLPAGQASFVIDGRENARGAFGLTPGARKISFGIDQLVRVKSSAQAVQGVVPSGKNKNVQWLWRVDVTNGHDRNVTVQVEEAAPILRDSRISAKVETAPEAVFDAARSRYVWTLDMPAHKSESVRYGVDMTAPEDVSTASNR